MPHPDAPAGTLGGRRVLITRSVDRAGPLAALLGSLGAEPLVLPLIDFERAADQPALDAALDALAAGGFDWLVVSSITTVRMLVEKAAERGTTPAALVPAGTRVATIGPSSRWILEAAGIPVALAPVDIQSAEGLVDLWTAAPEHVLLPQADIAGPALRDGLAAKGADVTPVVAYHTVDYPARPELRLEAELPSAVGLSHHGSPRELSQLQTRRELDAGTLDAVVAVSPSAARRIAATLLPLGRCRFIAIGRPTAAEAAALGIPVAATAQVPTPDGIVAALGTVFANERNTV
ncbi:uroporphyrinogen-III synthase [Arthrobacter sp. AQ5-06]|nr:uroporphyrinogen-III synthase [Arthrobacter sp. AQ5-06]